MLRALCWLGILWCCTLAVLAAPPPSAAGHSHAPAPRTPRTLTFVTDPPGATILDQYSEPLGLSGQPVNLDFSKYTTDVELVFRLEGYADLRWRDSVTHLSESPSERFPEEGPLRLVVSQPLVAWRGWLLRHPGGALAGGLGLMVLLGLASRARQGQRRRERELERREQLLAEVPRHTSLSATVLGPYRLLDAIGQGGMARVYRGLPEASLDPDEAVAVKVLRREAFEIEEVVDRFRREAQVTLRLNHPHILRLIDWGQDRGYTYLVVELLSGGTLRERLSTSPIGLSPEGAWSYLKPLFQAVAYAHTQGVIHRDLKPENVMFTAGGCLKVTDFGLARALDQQKITVTGSALGTPAYMSPEQIQGLEPRPGFDQYALGAMTYELLTGHTPFEAADPVQMIFMHLTQDVAPPSTLKPLSAEVDAVVLKMLAKDPQDRYLDLVEAARDLERALRG